MAIFVWSFVWNLYLLAFSALVCGFAALLGWSSSEPIKDQKKYNHEWSSPSHCVPIPVEVPHAATTTPAQLCAWPCLDGALCLWIERLPLGMGNTTGSPVNLLQENGTSEVLLPLWLKQYWWEGAPSISTPTSSELCKAPSCWGSGNNLMWYWDLIMYWSLFDTCLPGKPR